jgi:hypothetical protein
LRCYGIRDFSSHHEFLENIHEQLSLSQASTVYALYLRADYGGMESDKEMLFEAAEIWARRYITNRIPVIYFDEKSPSSDDCVYDLFDGMELKLHEWELAAVDFHVSQIHQWLLGKFSKADLCILQNFFSTGQDSEKCIEALKDLIWTESSAKNGRKEICIEGKRVEKYGGKYEHAIKALWQRNEGKFRELAQNLLLYNAFKKDDVN